MIFKRKDGTKVKDLPSYRILMPYLMPGRNESIVYYDAYANVEKLIKFMDEIKRDKFHVTLTHILVTACGIGFYKNPTMNRFVIGNTLYQRNKVEISFSMKKEKKEKSPVKVVKVEIKEEDTLKDIVEKINKKVQRERSDKETALDKEINLVTKLPKFLLKFLIGFARFLDNHNLLPYFLIKNDPLYSSLFIANLGSIGMNAAFHHLYEYGTISIFITVGKIEDRVVVEDGKPAVKKMLHIRFSYDERIDDGMTSSRGIQTVIDVLEDPYKYIKIE